MRDARYKFDTAISNAKFNRHQIVVHKNTSKVYMVFFIEPHIGSFSVTYRCLELIKENEQIYRQAFKDGRLEEVCEIFLESELEEKLS